MLQNDYLVAKIGVDTAENGPSKAEGVMNAVMSPAEAEDVVRRGGLCARLALQSHGSNQAPRALEPDSQRNDPPRHITLSEARSQLYRR